MTTEDFCVALWLAGTAVGLFLCLLLLFGA